MTGTMTAGVGDTARYRDRESRDGGGNPWFYQEDDTLADQDQLERFLKCVERRAYRLAHIALADADDALDVVQDAMHRLVSRYGSRPAEEWTPLFYRILNSRITDYHRKRKLRSTLFGWLTPHAQDDHDAAEDPLHRVADPGMRNPADQLATDKAIQTLDGALAALPARQQQAVALRLFEGLDVAETALAMGCSEGSVKTHYSRAIHSLRATLGEHWP